MRTPSPTTTRWILVAAVLVLVVAAVVLVAGRSGGGDPPAPAAPPAAVLPVPPSTTDVPALHGPDRFTAAERRAIARDQRRAAADHGDDAPDSDAEARAPETTVETGPSGDGALARALPVAVGDWRFALESVSAAEGVYVVTATPRDGRPVTQAAAARALRDAATAAADDPDGYRAIVPMSVLKGARHHDEETP